MNIISFGEILFDVFGKDLKIGGAPFNFAAHASRAGAKTYLVSAVGRDDLGDLAVRRVSEYGVDTRYISRSDKYETGVCRVTLDQNGVPFYELATPAAYDDIQTGDELLGKSFDLLYFGTLSLRCDHNVDELKKLIERINCDEILVDLNVREPFCRKKSLEFALENATILKISEEELPFVMKEAFLTEESDNFNAMKIIAKRFIGVKLILVTCGGNGSWAYDTKSESICFCSAVKTQVVSTVGAGDSYAATFIYHYMNKEPIEVCMEKASAVSAFVVSRAEAIPE